MVLLHNNCFSNYYSVSNLNLYSFEKEIPGKTLIAYFKTDENTFQFFLNKKYLISFRSYATRSSERFVCTWLIYHYVPLVRLDAASCVGAGTPSAFLKGDRTTLTGMCISLFIPESLITLSKNSLHNLGVYPKPADTIES